MNRLHSTHRNSIQVALALLLSLGGVSSQAAEVPTQANWSATAGSEIGHDESRGSMAGIDYLGSGTRGLTFGLSGLHAVTPPVNDASGANQTSTTSGQAYLRYGNDTLRGGLSFDSTSDEGYRHSKQLSATLHSGLGHLVLDVAVSRRDTRFESFSVSTEAATHFSTIPHDPVASCALNDTGYSGTLTYAANAWSMYVSGGANTYQNTACSFAVDVQSAFLRLSRSNLQSAAGALFDRAQLRSGGQIGEQFQLLQSQAGAGIARAFDRATLSIDYQHARSEFGGTSQDGYSLSGTMPVRRGFDVKLTLGNTMIDSASSPYIGLYAIAQF